jgi:hypothetical protein
MQEEYVARCVKENLAEIFKARKEKLKWNVVYAKK